MSTTKPIFLLLVASVFGLACGAADTSVARNTAPELAENEGFLALTVKTTHGARIFLKDWTSGKKMFLYAPLGQEAFSVHKLAQGKYCLDKVDWLERSLNGSPPSVRLRRQHECVQVAAGKLAYGGHWELSLSTVGEMRISSTVKLPDIYARLRKDYAALVKQYQVFVPDNMEWHFEFLNKSRT